ncbi:MAG: chemotaxis protein CheW [Bacteriovorax sp.]
MNDNNLSSELSLSKNSTSVQFLTFFIKGEVFALDIKSIKEILNYRPITKMPFMPDFIHGVLNLRGVVLPVIDLSARLHNETASIGARSTVLIIETAEAADSQTIGVLVDGVSEVLSLESSHIDMPPQFGAHLRPEFITGVTRLNDNFIIILNQGTVFSMEEMTTQIGLYSSKILSLEVKQSKNEETLNV